MIYIRAYAEENYSLLLKDFSKKMKESLTEEVFRETIDKYFKEYGDVICIKYLGHLNRSVGHQLLWKGQYKKNAEDVLWHLYLSEDDGQREVVGLWFEC